MDGTTVNSGLVYMCVEWASRNSLDIDVTVEGKGRTNKQCGGWHWASNSQFSYFNISKWYKSLRNHVDHPGYSKVVMSQSMTVAIVNIKSNFDRCLSPPPQKKWKEFQMIHDLSSTKFVKTFSLIEFCIWLECCSLMNIAVSSLSKHNRGNDFSLCSICQIQCHAWRMIVQHAWQ